MDRRHLGHVARSMDLDLRLSDESRCSDARSLQAHQGRALFQRATSGSLGPEMGAGRMLRAGTVMIGFALGLALFLERPEGLVPTVFLIVFGSTLVLTSPSECRHAAIHASESGRDPVEGRPERRVRDSSAPARHRRAAEESDLASTHPNLPAVRSRQRR